MKEKNNKCIKTNIIGFVIGIVVCGGVSVIAATYFPSNQARMKMGQVECRRLMYKLQEDMGHNLIHLQLSREIGDYIKLEM